MSDTAFRPRANDNANDNAKNNSRLDGQLKRATNEFQSDAAAIEEAPVPLSAHAALFVVIALLAAAVIWSAVGTLDRIVVAPGKIATRTPMTGDGRSGSNTSGYRGAQGLDPAFIKQIEAQFGFDKPPGEPARRRLLRSPLAKMRKVIPAD